MHTHTHKDVTTQIHVDTPNTHTHTTTYKDVTTHIHVDTPNTHSYTHTTTYKDVTTQTHVDIPNTHTHPHTTAYKDVTTQTRHTATHTLFSFIFGDLKISSELGGLTEALVNNSYFFLTFEECALIIQNAGLAVRVQVLEWPQGGRDSACPASSCTVQAEPLGLGGVGVVCPWPEMTSSHQQGGQW